MNILLVIQKRLAVICIAAATASPIFATPVSLDSVLASMHGGGARSIDMNSALAAMNGAKRAGSQFRGGGSGSAKQWNSSPGEVSISVEMTNVMGTVFGSCTLSLDKVKMQPTIVGCTNASSVGPYRTKLKINKKYRMIVLATNVDSYNISMNMDTPVSFLNPLDPRLNVTKGYRIEVDGVQSGLVTKESLGCTSVTSNSWNVTVRKDPNNTMRLDDDSNDPDFAPGDSKWVEIGPGKSDQTNACAIAWTVGLGHLIDGNSAGKLVLRENGITQDTYTPASIFYSSKSQNVSSQIETIEEEGNLRQLMCPQAFVDIVAETNQYHIRFYHPNNVGEDKDDDGRYINITGTPLVTYTILNPDGTNTITNRLYIVEYRDGVYQTNKVEFNPTNATWSAICGTGSEQRIQTRQISFPTAGERDETAITKSAAGTVASKSTEKYQLIASEWRLIETVGDPDSAALLTQLDYYTDGKLKSIINPDGTWEKRVYESNGGLSYVLRPFGDGPTNPATADEADCIVTTYGYPDLYVSHGPVGFAESGMPNNLLRDEYSRSSDESRSYAIWEAGDFYAEGMAQAIYGTNAGVGLADHLQTEMAWGVRQRPEMKWYSYDIGNYDATNRTFAVDSEGKCWRMTMEQGRLPVGAWNDESASLIDRVSTREVTITQNGAVAQTELYVYTPETLSQYSLIEKKFYSIDRLGHTTNITHLDPSSAQSRVIYEASYKGPNGTETDLLRSEKDQFGLETQYTYDSLKRLKSVTLLGVASQSGFAAQANITTNLTYDAAGNVTTNIVTGGSLSLTNTATFDKAGRRTSTTDAAGLTTSFSFLNGGLALETILPGGATIVRSNYLDGKLKSITGTAVTNEYHTYEYIVNTSTELPRYCAETIHYGTPTSARVVTNVTDSIARLIRSSAPSYNGGSVTTEYGYYSFIDTDFGGLGCQLRSIATPGRGTMQIEYDFHGRKTKQTVEDRMSETVFAFAEDSSNHWFSVTTNLTYNESGGKQMTSVQRVQLTGLSFTSGVLSRVFTQDVDTNLTVSTTYANRATKLSHIISVSDISTLESTNITFNGLLVANSGMTFSGQTVYTYDALRRQLKVVGPLGFGTGTRYSPQSSQVTATTNAAGLVTTIEYYTQSSINAGQIKSTTSPAGKTTRFEYDLQGHTVRTWGDVPYPEERTYNSYGELTALKTFRAGANWGSSTWPSSTGAADTTHYYFQESTGLLTNKTDALGHAVLFTYNENNLPQTRIWARGSSLTNSYNSYGDVVKMDYSDGTPSVEYSSFNHAGSPTLINDATGSHMLVYDHANRLVSDAVGEITITNHFNRLHGRDSLAVLGLSESITQNFGCDAVGRLSTVSSGVYQSCYGYLPNSDLVGSITNRNNGTNVLITKKEYEYGYRLTNIVNTVASVVVTSFGYQYDSSERRTRMAMSDGSFWRYEYNDRDEVTSAVHYWSDSTPVAGQQYSYNFDNIGNRSKSSSGGDEWGGMRRWDYYSVNELNE